MANKQESEALAAQPEQMKKMQAELHKAALIMQLEPIDILGFKSKDALEISAKANIPGYDPNKSYKLDTLKAEFLLNTGEYYAGMVDGSTPAALEPSTIASDLTGSEAELDNEIAKLAQAQTQAAPAAAAVGNTAPTALDQATVPVDPDATIGEIIALSQSTGAHVQQAYHYPAPGFIPTLAYFLNPKTKGITAVTRDKSVQGGSKLIGRGDLIPLPPTELSPTEVKEWADRATNLDVIQGGGSANTGLENLSTDDSALLMQLLGKMQSGNALSAAQEAASHKFG